MAVPSPEGTLGAMSARFDLAAWLARIGYAGPLTPDVHVLSALHAAQATAIPFENLDIQMGLPIRLDLASVQDKLVRRQRGGYCFEQNTLFQHALRTLGFEVVACEARVRTGTSAVLPRTHMLGIVRVDGLDWLCDVGFGAEGLLEPVAMDGQPVSEFDRDVRVIDEGHLRVLQARKAGTWTDLYAFEPEEREPIDFEMANWYTSTHPSSRFVLAPTAQRLEREGRHAVRGRVFTSTTRAGTTSREIARREFVPLLRDVFGIDVPADARFRGLDGAPA